MPFPRVQGNKLLILHSKRVDGQVRQIKLHTFDTFTDAQDVVHSDTQWELFCETLTLQASIKFNTNRLRKTIRAKLNSIEFDDTNPTSRAVLQVLGFLLNCKPPLFPKQIQILKKIKPDLLELKNIINKKLTLLEEPMKSLTRQVGMDADKCMDLGLDYYEQGKWDEARRLFLQGLQTEPNHVDLLVHVGLIELIHENYTMALKYFNNAAEIGRQLADLMIATDPDEYIKSCDINKWAENKVCDLADECPDCFTDKCNDCDESPKNKKTELYRYFEFRPFFRSLTNKALTLMKLKRFEDAIDTLKLCQEYQPLWGTYNLIGVCYLSLGHIKEADSWYHELLWDETYYVKSLIKHLRNQTDNAFKYLLPGIIKNRFIAAMLIGIDKIEDTRYLGDALPDRLKASEFIHERGYLFKKHPDFRNLIRCIFDNGEISDLLDKLESEKDKKKHDKNHNMDKTSWDLLYGTISDDFINRYVLQLIDRLNDENGAYWKPKAGGVLSLRLIEKKQQNWLVKLNNFKKEFYLRPRNYIEEIKNGDVIRICVAKSWYYRKRLFVSGDIERGVLR